MESLNASSGICTCAQTSWSPGSSPHGWCSCGTAPRRGSSGNQTLIQTWRAGTVPGRKHPPGSCRSECLRPHMQRIIITLNHLLILDKCLESNLLQCPVFTITSAIKVLKIEVRTQKPTPSPQSQDISKTWRLPAG